jgi:hypothetical protein
MNSALKNYEIKWHTRPSVGAAYYEGTKRVMAKDEGDAVEKARTELAQTYGRSRIVIDEVGHRL